jgi:tape measure domain-containing protein
VSVVANVAINLDARGVVERLKAIRQSSSEAADGFKRLQDRAQAVKAIVEAQQGTFAKASTVQGVFSARVLNTEKAIRAQIAALREVQSSVKLGGALYQKAASQIQAYEKTLRDVNAQEKINNNTRGGAIASLGRLAASFAVLQAGRFIFAKAAELQSQARSLEVLTGSTEKAGKIIKELQQLGAVTPFTSTELIDSAKRLQAFGVEADKVVETTRRLADASGATGAELSGLVTAYGQVQAKGRLQGEELLQFQERGIALQEELRKMYGMTGEEFQKALSKGQISAKAVEVALVNLTSAGGKYANGAIAQSDTLNGRLSTLQDGIDGVARSVGAVLSPVVLEILKEANRVLSIMPGLVDDIGLAFQYAAGRLAPFLNGLSQIQWYFKNLTPPGWAMQVTGGAGGAFRGIVQEGANRQRAAASGGYVSRFAGARDAAFKQAQMIGETPRVPPPLGATGGGGGRAGRAGGGADKAAREAERALEIQKQQLKAADDQNFALKNRFAILQETEAVAKRELELDVRLNEIAREYGELKENAKSNDELILINASLILEKKAAELEAEREINDLIAERVRLMAQLTQEAMQPTVYNELETQDAALQSILDKYPAIGAAADAAATMATSGIQAMIAGTKSAEQVFVEFLSSIADALIDTAKQMIAQYIAIGIARMFAGMGGGGGGGFAPSGPLAAVGNINPMPASFTPFAEGGFVTGPTPAMVGEGGEPEYIIPASKMSAAMKRYGGGARGSAVIPTSGDTSEAGGNATAVNGAIDVRYTVERINSVDYVTADQFQQGMQQAAMQGAQRGEQRTLRRLQTSTSTRRRLGV